MKDTYFLREPTNRCHTLVPSLPSSTPTPRTPIPWPRKSKHEICVFRDLRVSELVRAYVRAYVEGRREIVRVCASVSHGVLRTSCYARKYAKRDNTIVSAWAHPMRAVFTLVPHSLVRAEAAAATVFRPPQSLQMPPPQSLHMLLGRWCSQKPAYLLHTCCILAAYLLHTCCILAAYLLHTCCILAAKYT